jgi:hypothetical protein
MEVAEKSEGADKLQSAHDLLLINNNIQRTKIIFFIRMAWRVLKESQITKLT